jgi:hypothetical protein
MSVVVEAVKGVVDFAGDVIQGVLDDPLSAIATAAAFSFGMPFLGLKAGALAAGVANTAAGLVQGEDFDEALKGGVVAGVGSWAGGKLAGGFGDDVAAAAADDVAAAKAANMVDDFGSNYSGTAQSTLPKAAGPSSGYTGGTTAPSFSASNISGSAGDDILASSLDESLSSSLKVQGANLGDEVVGLNPGQQNYLRSSTAGPGMGSESYAGGNLAKEATGDVIEGYGKVSHGSSYASTPTHLSSYTGPQNYVNVLDDAGNVGTNVKSFDVVQNTGGQNLVSNPYPNVSNEFNPLYSDASASAAGSGYNVIDAAGKELAGYWDDVAGYGSKAIDWAKAHPLATTAGVVGTGLAVKSLMDKKGEEEDRLTEEQRRMQEQMAEAEKTYYDPLVQYTLNRQVYTPYTEEELSRYGEDKGGEGRFFSNSVYEPYTGYQEGGSVMPQAPSKMNPAFAFYKYGNVPESVRRYEGGGYAEGGSRGDGRSDHIEALLSPGEFVMDAETVSMLGNGSSEAGARRLEEMRQAVRKQKGGALSKGKFSPDAKSPLAYLSKKR